MNAHVQGRNVVVTVTGADGEGVRKAARKAACAEAHTALIGKLLKVAETRDGHAYTWGPVTARKTGAARTAPRKAAPVVAADSPAGDALAMLGTLGLTPEQLATVLAMLTGKAPAATRETFAPVAKAAARKAAAACKTCEDHGVVRKTPRGNGSVNYRTGDGAKASTAIGNSQPCEARGCKAGKAARKSRKAA